MPVAIDNRLLTGFQMKSKSKMERSHCGVFPQVLPPSHLSPGRFSRRLLHQRPSFAPERRGRRAPLKARYAPLEHAAKVMKAEGKPSLSIPICVGGAVEKRSRDGGELQTVAFGLTGFCRGLKEGVILTGQQTPEGIADFYLSRGVRRWSLKPAATARLFKSANGEQGTVDAIKVENVVDTVGAGGGFAVGVISAPLEGKTLLQAVNRGNKIGSLAIQVGRQRGLPTATRWANNIYTQQ